MKVKVGGGAPLDALRTSRAGEALRVLLVDDFAPFRETLCSVFLPYESMIIVGEAADGEAAIELAVRLAPHVIIMDVKMPRISGVEATRRIKRFLPGVHVIGVSTQDDTFIKESMKAVGASHFVTKECANTIPDVISRITGWPITKDYFSEGTV
jgi:DNA-binding NarL/FixJ family response regulator